MLCQGLSNISAYLSSFAALMIMNIFHIITCISFFDVLSF